MLSKVLKKETCAKCKICCGFVNDDKWEIPLFDKKTADKISNSENIKLIKVKDKYTYDLCFKSEEIRYCPFLDKAKGCILYEKEKPFECKIWPIRPMNKNGKLVFAVANICPAFENGNKDKLKALLNSGLKEKILDYASENPEIIKEFNNEYTVLNV